MTIPLKNTVLFGVITSLFLISTPTQALTTPEESTETSEDQLLIETPNYIEASIQAPQATEILKSTIFDASQSFIPKDIDNPEAIPIYRWNFGDGSTSEGIEVLHTYQEPGHYTVKLQITQNGQTEETTTEIFAYKKLITLITDKPEAEARMEILQKFAEEQGVYINLIQSFGASTEFISEEILSKKLREDENNIRRAKEILVWTRDNAGITALAQYKQNSNQEENPFNQKSIIVISDNLSSSTALIQRQFEIIKAQNIIITQEGSLNTVIESEDSTENQLIQELERGGYPYQVVNEATGKIRPWNFMSFFVNLLTTNGIPNNTIALLLLLPIIATVVAFMRQVVGMTTYGIYTPSIITLSFLVIGIYAGLLTLTTAIIVGAITRPLLKKVRMLFIPKMAIVITVVSLALLVLLIASIYLQLFDAQFLSIAIFPMLILSTLVEKFVSTKSGQGFSSAIALTISTVIVSIIAYIIAGGELSIGLATIKIEWFKNSVMSHPELVFLLIIINIILGRWSGLRVMERIRFREVFRHIEEEE